MLLSVYLHGSVIEGTARGERPGAAADRGPALAGGQLLVAGRGAADVAPLRPLGGRRGAGPPGPPRAHPPPVVLLLAGLPARARPARRDRPGPLRRLPGPPHRRRPGHRPDLPGRAHVGGELGPRLAAGPRPGR